MSKNVHPAPVPDVVPDAGWVPDGCRTQRGDQELSNKKKFVKIGPLLRKLWAKMSIQHQCQTRCRMGAGQVPDAKRRSRAFKQKKVYQNRTIIKEVMSKNVHPAPVPDGCRTGAGRVPDGCRMGAGWIIRHRCWMDIFAHNFLNNGPILINFFLFESSWSPLCTHPAPSSTQHYPAPSGTQHYPAPSTYNPACACASYLLMLVCCSRLHHPAPVRHHPAPNTI